MKKIKPYQGGRALLRTVVLVPVLVIGSALAYFGFCEARKAYWDREVRQMCEKDGVKIYETVALSKKQYAQFGRVAGFAAIPVRNLAKDEILFSENVDTYIRRNDPEIRGSEVVIKHRDTQKVVARYGLYSRVGGDFPSFAHPSSFGCPQPISIYRDLEKIFVIKGE